MKFAKFLGQTSIQRRFLLVTLTPLLLVTILLTVYTVKARQQDAQDELLSAGNDAASYFATAAEFPLYAGNQEALKELTSAINQLRYISGAIVLDASQKPLAFSGEVTGHMVALDALPETGVLASQYTYLKRPVYPSGVNFLDYAEGTYTEGAPQDEFSEPIGWILVTLDQGPIQNRNREILVASVTLSISGLLLAVLLSYYLGRSITQPIANLTRAVRTLETGDLSARASINTHDELAVLAKGINQLAQTISDNRENLQQQISEATSELELALDDLRVKNRELDLARENAEMANQAKSEFLARMSHELRTPITAIQGFIHLLTEVASDDSEHHYCKIIDQAAGQQLILIDDILVFSKLQSNTVELERQPFNLGDCIEGVAALFSTQAQNKNLDLLVDFDPAVEFSRIGDAHRLSQIINNLVSNAIKFTSEGSVSIEVVNHESLPQRIEIRVRDTGIGIENDKLEQIFQAFTQADTSISRRYGGTGLGLSIVRNLVDLMGGHINIDSARGQGTVFTISLALEKQRNQQQWSPLNKRVAVYASKEPKVRAVCHALQRLGCNCAVFNEPAELPASGFDAIVAYLSPNCFENPDFPAQTLYFRSVTPLPAVFLTPVISLSQLFTNEEIQRLQPASFIAHPAPLFSLYNALQQKSLLPVPAADKADLLPLDGLNILVAEDNDFTGLLLETLISKSGGSCTIATDGLEALKASSQEKFDVMLFDVHMPELNGIECTRQVRESGNINAGTPIVALTADIVQQEEDALRKAGINDLLFKPLNENYLLERIRYHAGIKTGIRSNVEITSDDISTEAFYQEINRLLTDIRVAFNNRNTEKMRDIAHQLAGVAGVFKLESLDEKSRALHSAIKSRDDEEILHHLGIVEAEAKVLSAQSA